MNINCELGYIIEDVVWDQSQTKPKAKVNIPILMPLEKSDRPNIETKSINLEGGNSIKGSKSTYTTSNYITLNIPTHLFPEPVKSTYIENGLVKERSITTIPKGTEIIIVFIGGYIKIDKIRVISISL
jgi:hypothetical protein